MLLGQPEALIRGALAAVLSHERDLLVVAELARTNEVLTSAARSQADVAVLDASLPGTVTIGELCQAMRQRVPACRPLVLVERGSGLGRSLAPLAPWLGSLATDAVPAELAEAVRRLTRGAPVLNAGLSSAIPAAAENPLTSREREVLRLTRNGAPTKEIAKRLGLQIGTVRNYLSRALAKTGTRTALAAIRVAQDAGWI